MNNCRKLIFLFFSFFICFSLFAQKAWKKSDNNIYVWTDIKSSFLWKGPFVGDTYKIASGLGELISNNKSKKLDLYYGALEKDFNLTTDGRNTKYLCNSQGINGFGVIIKTNGAIYCGNFINGKIKGKGDLYNSWNLIYSGEIENNKQNGYGIEFQKDGTIKKGYFTNGIKNGKFLIETVSGKLCELEFINNIPNRNNCKITYKDGRIWIGSVDMNFEPLEGKNIATNGTIQEEKRINGKLEGKQKQVYPDKSIYDGEFVAGKRNGYGVMSYSNGLEYSGDWKDDYQDGFGSLIIDDKSYYVGNWAKKYRDGLLVTPLFIYDGEWNNGKKDGFGSLIIDDKSYYVGNWAKKYGDVQSTFNGDGLLVTPLFIYDGEWNNGKKDGFGTLSISNATYEGEWKNDSINGKGLVIFQDDSYYDGEWKNNKRHGYGEYVWANGDAYYGEWKEDVPNGIGTISLSNGDSYSGEFENGTYSGEGVYTWKNGDRYEGIFDNNIRTKLGTYYYANGNLYDGSFKNNKPDGKGKFFFKNGSYYEGNFREGKFYGKGDLFIPDGNEYIILSSELWTGTSSVPPKGIFIFPDGEKTPVVRNTNGELIPDECKTSSVNYQKFKKGIEVTQTVLGIVNIVATVCEFIPCPPVQVVAKAVDTICDVTDLALSVAHAGMETATYVNDKEVLTKYGASQEELALLKKNYEKSIRGDVISVALTGTLMGVQAAKKTVKNADKALEINPEFEKSLKAIDKIGETAETAKAAKKFSNGLVRGIVSIAYGKTGRKLITKYGDDAAQLLFKYGDNAFNALVKSGDVVVKLAKNSENGAALLSEVFKHGDKAIAAFTKYGDNAVDLIAKHGKKGLKLLDEYGDDLVKQYVKHGDDIIELITKVGGNSSKNGKLLLKTLEKSSDDVCAAIIKASKNSDSPRDINRVVRYLDTFGDDGLKNIKKWGGKIPENITYRQIQLWKKINSSGTRKLANKLKQLPGLKLSNSEIEMCLQDPKMLRQLVVEKTGQSFRDGYQEFFIRMKNGGNPDQIKALWKNQGVKDFIKNNGIRAGGVHEWLMAKNFEDFLTNPKWEDSGEYLSLALEKLVQKTDNVAFKNGGVHGGYWSHTFHDRLSEVIDSCNNASEVYEKINNFAKQVLTYDSYIEFNSILYSVF